MLRSSEYTITLLTDHDESFRLDRLARVVHHVRRCGSPGALAYVIALHDHEGLLSVNWRTMPPTTALAAIINAWASEHECTSNHYLRSRPLFGDVEKIEWPASPEDARRSIRIDGED
jgi:hypothetical protein